MPNMAYEVILRPGAQKALDKMSPELRARILVGIHALHHDPRPTGCKKLIGKRSYYRIRVGDYRVIYTIDDGILRVLVVEVGHRGGIYG
jgi:mRNA interferase RelE/StbE